MEIFRSAFVAVFVPVFLSAILSTVFLLSFASLGQALDPATNSVSLPRDIPPLPDPQRPEERLFITRENVALFHELLIAPLAAWVKEKKMVMSVVSQINFRWTYSRAWMEGSVAQSGQFDLDVDHNLIALGGKPIRGFPFGDADDINSEADSARRAYKILWNMSYAEAPSEDVLYGINLYWVGTQALLRKSMGQFYRRFSLEPNIVSSSPSSPLASPLAPPAAARFAQNTSQDNITLKNTALPQPTSLPQSAGADLQTPPLFGAKWDIFRRDVLQLVSPPVVFGYATIGWRYRGTDDDALWMYSPVIERRRQLLDSNRSDSLLGGALTLDDLFVWSGKIQGVDARVVEDKVLLVPFPALSPYALVEESISRKLPSIPNELSSSPVPTIEPKVQAVDVQVEYEKIRAVNGLFEGSDQKPETMLWNFANKKFLNFAPWLPTEVRFVPRRVWILELSPKDPFYQAGRQILVVDQESMLPVYKVVYNRHGGYQRTIVGGWGLAATEDGSIRFPFSAYVLAVEQGFDPAVCVSHSYIRTFLGKSTKLSADLETLLHVEAHGAKGGNSSGTTPSAMSDKVKKEESTVTVDEMAASDESGSADAVAPEDDGDSEAGVDAPPGQIEEDGPEVGNTQRKIWGPT